MCFLPFHLMLIRRETLMYPHLLSQKTIRIHSVTQSKCSFIMKVNNSWSESRLIIASHMIVSQQICTVCTLGKCGISWVAVRVCVVVDGSGISAAKTGGGCVCMCVRVCPNVLDYKQVTQHTQPIGGSEGRQRGMGEAAQANNRLATQQE